MTLDEKELLSKMKKAFKDTKFVTEDNFHLINGSTDEFIKSLEDMYEKETYSKST